MKKLPPDYGCLACRYCRCPRGQPSKCAQGLPMIGRKCPQYTPILGRHELVAK